jgi:hypothetical protein
MAEKLLNETKDEIETIRKLYEVSLNFAKFLQSLNPVGSIQLDFLKVILADETMFWQLQACHL